MSVGRIFHSTTNISLHDRFTVLKTVTPTQKFQNSSPKHNNNPMGSRRNQQLIAQMETKFSPASFKQKGNNNRPKQLMSLELGHVSAKERLSIPAVKRINTFLGNTSKGSITRRVNNFRGTTKNNFNNRIGNRISNGSGNQHRGKGSIGNRLTAVRGVGRSAYYTGKTQMGRGGNLNANSRTFFKSNQKFNGASGRGQNRRGRGQFRGRGRAW